MCFFLDNECNKALKRQRFSHVFGNSLHNFQTQHNQIFTEMKARSSTWKINENKKKQVFFFFVVCFLPLLSYAVFWGRKKNEKKFFFPFKLLYMYAFVHINAIRTFFIQSRVSGRERLRVSEREKLFCLLWSIFLRQIIYFC